MKEIYINSKHCQGRPVIVDDEDYEFLKNRSWHVDVMKPSGYIRIRVEIDGKMIPLSHAIIGKPEKGLVVDHKDRDVFNNQKDNLRAVTRRINNVNTGNANRKQSDNCQYRGVSWIESEVKFRVQITYKYKVITLGRFHDPVEAAKNYDYHAIRINGEYAILNFPDFDYTDFVPYRTLDYDNLEISQSVRDRKIEGVKKRKKELKQSASNLPS